MDTVSSAYFIPREKDKTHQLYKRVRMMPLYSFPCLKYYNLSKKEHHNRYFIHFDLDCFYPQVETRDNPKYRGKPVGVISVTDSKTKGIVMSSNYEAREKGVDTAMSVYQALAICPEIILINCYGQKYESILNGIKEMIYHYVPEDCLEQYSIDECFVDLSPVCQSWKQAINLSIEFKKKIWWLEKLTTSLGLSYNKTYAKMATKLQKPDGLTVIRHEDKEKMLYHLPVDKIWGIGQRNNIRMSFHRIKTIGDLAKSNEYEMRKEFGINGICFYRMSRGEETTEIFHKVEHEKMLMNQHSRDNATAYEPDILKEIKNRVEYLCRKMRAKKLTAKGLILFLRYDNLLYDVEQAEMSQYTNNDRILFNAALILYKKIKISPTVMIKLTGLAVYDLKQDIRRTNYSLFDEIKEMPFHTIDKVKQRYGESAIRIGLNK